MENRIRIQFYHQEGVRDAKQVHQRSGIPLRTCYRIFNKLNQGKNLEHKKGAGRPKKLKEDDTRRILQFAHHHPKSSSAELGVMAVRNGSPAVHRTTVWRALKRRGMKKWTPSAKPMLTDAHKRARVAWCIANQERDWSNVIFTDESYFQYYRNKVMEWGYSRPSKATPKHGPAVMIWGGFGKRGKTPLKVAQQSVNADYYQQILNECLIGNMNALYPDGFILQQDNARPHIAKTTKKFLADNGVEVIQWPACSPDLNPIENLWQIIKHRLEKKEKKNVGEWKVAIEEIWEEISHDLLESLINDMPKRIKECIEGRGDKIKR